MARAAVYCSGNGGGCGSWAATPGDSAAAAGPMSGLQQGSRQEMQALLEGHRRVFKDAATLHDERRHAVQGHVTPPPPPPRS
eukprot:gene465-11230_t